MADQRVSIFISSDPCFLILSLVYVTTFFSFSIQFFRRACKSHHCECVRLSSISFLCLCLRVCVRVCAFACARALLQRCLVRRTVHAALFFPFSPWLFFSFLSLWRLVRAGRWKSNLSLQGVGNDEVAFERRAKGPLAAEKEERRAHAALSRDFGQDCRRESNKHKIVCGRARRVVFAGSDLACCVKFILLYCSSDICAEQKADGHADARCVVFARVSQVHGGRLWPDGARECARANDESSHGHRKRYGCQVAHLWKVARQTWFVVAYHADNNNNNNTNNRIMIQFNIYLHNMYTDDQELTGLARGGQRIKTCKETYVKSLDGLIKLASLQVECRINNDNKQ